MLAQYIESGDLQGAIDIYNHGTIKDVTLSNLINTPEDSDKSRMTAEILKIKKAKTKKQKGDNKFMKVEKTYDRLVLLR